MIMTLYDKIFFLGLFGWTLNYSLFMYTLFCAAQKTFAQGQINLATVVTLTGGIFFGLVMAVGLK